MFIGNLKEVEVHRREGGRSGRPWRCWHVLGCWFPIAHLAANRRRCHDAKVYGATAPNSTTPETPESRNQVKVRVPNARPFQASADKRAQLLEKPKVGRGELSHSVTLQRILKVGYTSPIVGGTMQEVHESRVEKAFLILTAIKRVASARPDPNSVAGSRCGNLSSCPQVWSLLRP